MKDRFPATVERIVVIGGSSLGGSTDRQVTVPRVVDGGTLDVSYDGELSPAAMATWPAASQASTA